MKRSYFVVTFSGACLVLVLIITSVMIGCTGYAPPEEKFPANPITIIVPWAAGGRSDSEVRALSPFLEKKLGVPIVVANHPGGSGIVGAEVVYSSRADGYTLGSFSISHILRQYTANPPFELEKFDTVAQTVAYPFTITVNADSPWNTLSDFIDYAKAHPGELKAGTVGTGAITHIVEISFAKEVGIQVGIYAPYQGDSQAAAALAGGEIDFIGAPPASIIPLTAAGKLRVLAITTEDRSALYPDFPTMVEQGIDFTAAGFSFLAVPKGTPAANVDKIEAAVSAVLSMTQVKQTIENIGLDVQYRNSNDLDKLIEEWDQRFKDSLKELGML